MSEEKVQQQKISETIQEAGQQPIQKQDVASALSKLSKSGGFNLIKRMLPDAERLDPQSKATRNMFLKEQKFAEKREQLADDIKKWLTLLEEDKSAHNLADICDQNQKKYQELFNRNIAVALETIKDLETSYRTLDTFYKNTGEQKLDNLRIVNVDKFDLDDSNSEFIQEIDRLLKTSYDRLSLKDSYSLIAMPGYIFKNNTILKMWAELAKRYKTLLLSDHDDEMSYNDLIETIKDRNYSDSDSELQNVILCCNWILGRNAEKLAGEEGGLYIPPSGALAGLLYDKSVPMAQGRAGKKYGTLREVAGVKLDLLVSEMKPIVDQNIVPMVFSEGRVMAFNNKTLFNGNPDAMQEYPIVRVYDWIKKVLIYFLHGKAFENWDVTVARKLETDIKEFLNANKGFGKLFEDYNVSTPVQDKNTKTITIDIDIKPFFAAKEFTVKLKTVDDKNSCDIEEK